jgi:hypothetical protein
MNTEPHITDIVKLTPVAGDVIVVKVDDSVITPRVHKLIETLVKCLPKGCSYIILSQSQTLEHLKEADMNRIGWHRVKTSGDGS